MIKPLTYTAHALARLEEREINRLWIEDTIRRTDRRKQDPLDAALERPFRAIEEFAGRALRIVRFETAARVIVFPQSIDLSEHGGDV